MFLFKSVRDSELSIAVVTYVFSVNLAIFAVFQLNYVMRHILTTGLEDIPVLLIEEDHYLTPDAIQFMSDIVRTKQALCPQCMFSQLGDYSKIKDDNFGTQFKQVNCSRNFSLYMRGGCNGEFFVTHFHVCPMDLCYLQLLVFNSRTAIAGANFGLLSVF